MPSKGNRAVVWKYFRKEGDKCVVCEICGQRLAYKSSTSTMRYHLDRKHPIHWENERETTFEEQLESASTEQLDNGDTLAAAIPVPIFTPSSTKYSSINFHITKLIVRDLLPLRQIHNSGMKQLLKHLEPTYTVPDVDTMIASIIRLYESVKPSIQQMLDVIGHISLSVEIWNSANTQLYGTISANWITNEWRMKSCVLSTQSLPVGYNWEDVELIINETLSIFNIPAKNVSAVVCQADFLIPSVTSFPVVRCFASTLNFAVRKSFEYPPVARIIQAVRKLVSNIKHLSGSIVELALQQSEVKVSEIQIEQDVSTFWFSTYDMLVQLRDQRSIICAVVGDMQMSKYSDGILSSANTDDWELLNHIIDILKPLKTSTEVLSAAKNVSLSSIFPILYGLNTVHLADTNEQCHAAWTFKQIIRKEIFAVWNLNSDQNLVPIFSSILDPRYHNLSYLSREQQESSVQTLNMELISTEIDNNAVVKTVATVSNKGVETYSPLDFLLGRHLLSERNISDTSSKESRESELKSYLDTVLNPPASTDCDPLFWWQCNIQRFPCLQLLACKYLGIPALCSPAELLFSVAGMQFVNARAQLESQCVDYVLFLHSNM